MVTDKARTYIRTRLSDMAGAGYRDLDDWLSAAESDPMLAPFWDVMPSEVRDAAMDAWDMGEPIVWRVAPAAEASRDDDDEEAINAAIDTATSLRERYLVSRQSGYGIVRSIIKALFRL